MWIESKVLLLAKTRFSKTGHVVGGHNQQRFRFRIHFDQLPAATLLGIAIDLAGGLGGKHAAGLRFHTHLQLGLITRHHATAKSTGIDPGRLVPSTGGE